MGRLVRHRLHPDACGVIKLSFEWEAKCMEPRVERSGHCWLKNWKLSMNRWYLKS